MVLPSGSDENGDATRGFGVAVGLGELKDVAGRSAFLIEDGETVKAAWELGNELPDIEAVIAAAEA